MISGTVAGAVSAFTFTILHDLFISDIWFSLLIMLIAGAICGLSTAWTYGLLFDTASVGSWVRYNLLYVCLFVFLGAMSVLIFDPVTTMAAVIEANEPPRVLFRQAMPMTIAFTLGMALLVNVLYKKSWRFYGASLLNCTVLVAFLGLNVSAIGLVYIPIGSFYLIIELLGLIGVLNLVYAGVFVGLERKQFINRTVEKLSQV